MPRLSVWAIRFSLIYLLIGFSLGALILANKGVPFAPWAWNLLPGHIDILLFGFVIQLAIGMAYWILPRFSGGLRGSAAAFWLCLGLLNLGIWAAALEFIRFVVGGGAGIGRNLCRVVCCPGLEAYPAFVSMRNVRAGPEPG